MSRRKLEDDFFIRARPTFEFLVDVEAFMGPERVPDGLAYHSPAYEIDVLLDRREQAIVTQVRAMVGDLHLRADLSCLYVEAGLGAAQEVKRTARTGHTLERSLSSQAQAVKRLLPILDGPSRDDLLRRCHAR